MTKLPKIIQGPIGHLFTIEDCRAQCRVVAIDTDSDGAQSHPDDALILAFLDAAVEAAEDFTGLSIAVKTFEIALDSFSECTSGHWLADRFRAHQRDSHIEIPVTPVVEVVSFKAGEGSDLVTLEPDLDYVLDDFHLYARLLPVTAWPSTARATNTIRIQVRAGYEVDTDGAGDVPDTIRQAVMLTMADWYSNREDSSEKAMTSIPNAAQVLLRPRRVRLGMA